MARGLVAGILLPRWPVSSWCQVRGLEAESSHQPGPPATKPRRWPATSHTHSWWLAHWCLVAEGLRLPSNQPKFVAELPTTSPRVSETLIFVTALFYFIPCFDVHLARFWRHSTNKQVDQRVKTALLKISHDCRSL